MSRSYRKIQEYEKEILTLKEQGKTLREIGEELGFTYKQVHNFITRYNAKQRKLAVGIPLKPKGRPNQKWVTDISYIHTSQGILYLSMIRDLYDNSVVAYKTGTEQNVNLVLSTLRAAKRKEKVTADLQLHSDQGFQYTSHGYFKLTQSYNITPSMSRRGNPYDNSLAENFFSILKTECIYRQKLKPMRRLASS